MAFSKSIFKPSKPESNYKIEKENGIFTLALYGSSFMFADENKNKNIPGFSFTEFDEETKKEDGRKIEISVALSSGNFTSVDQAFRKTVASAHGNRVIYLRDAAEIIEKYENYLVKSGFTVNSTHKTSKDHGGMSFNRNNAVF